MPELSDRVGEPGVTALVDKTHLPPADEPEAALPIVPTEVGAGRDDADLFNDTLADVGDEHVAACRVPAKPLGISDAKGVDLIERAALPRRRPEGRQTPRSRP